jgi:type IV secretory pathway TraG/TraD family ATPase VirD4
MNFFNRIQNFRVARTKFSTLSGWGFAGFYWIHIFFFVLILSFTTDGNMFISDVKNLLFKMHFGLFTKPEDAAAVAMLKSNMLYWFDRNTLSLVLASVVSAIFGFLVWSKIAQEKAEEEEAKAGVDIKGLKELAKIEKERCEEIQKRDGLTKAQTKYVQPFLPAVVHTRGLVPIEIFERVRHSLLVGAPGSGKTNFLNWNFESLGKSIVHDFKLDFTENFYRPNIDFLLNPFDERCVGWNIFNEIENPEIDVPELAKSLISDSTGEPYWSIAARDIFVGVMHVCIAENKKTNAAIWNLLQHNNESFVDVMKEHNQTKVLKHISDPNSKQTQGVLATLAASTQIFEILAKIDGDFSLKKWLRQEDDSVLFVANMPKAGETLKSLISLFFDFAAKEVLSWSDTRVAEVRINFLLDEFPRLHKMGALASLLTNGRSKGASVWLGTQSYKAVEARYGDEADDILNACSNRFYFWVNSAEAAESVSKDIGERRLEKVTETQSYAPNQQDISINFHKYEAVEKAVLTSELQNLNVGEMYFKLKNTGFFAKVTVTEKQLEKMNPGFTQKVGSATVSEVTADTKPLKILNIQ